MNHEVMPRSPTCAGVRVRVMVLIIGMNNITKVEATRSFSRLHTPSSDRLFCLVSPHKVPHFSSEPNRLSRWVHFHLGQNFVLFARTYALISLCPLVWFLLTFPMYCVTYWPQYATSSAINNEAYCAYYIRELTTACSTLWLRLTPTQSSIWSSFTPNPCFVSKTFTRRITNDCLYVPPGSLHTAWESEI